VFYLGKIKSLKLKLRLARERTKVKRLPIFVTLKTKRRVVRSPRWRHWRQRKLKLKTQRGELVG
jgi:large subunit ribosomal protein L39e